MPTSQHIPEALRLVFEHGEGEIANGHGQWHCSRMEKGVNNKQVPELPEGEGFPHHGSRNVIVGTDGER